MTGEEVDAAIGRLVSEYAAARRELVANVGRVRDLCETMHRVVNTAPESIELREIPEGGWPLREAVEDMRDCRRRVDVLERDLRDAGLGDLIQGR